MAGKRALKGARSPGPARVQSQPPDQKQPLNKLVFALECVDICNMGMMWTSLPIALASDEEPARWGYVTGAANAVALLCGTYLGRMSDVHGRQHVLWLSVFIFALASFLLSAGIFLESPGLLVGGALLSRTTSSSGAIRKALVSDSSDPADRTALLSKLAALGGCGFIVGPTLAGRLVALQLNYVIIMHLLLACLSIAMATQLCWDADTAAATEKHARKGKPAAAGGGGREGAGAGGAAAAAPGMRELLSSKGVPGLILACFLVSFGFQAFTSSFYHYCVQRFDFGAAEYGQLLSTLGIMWTTTQGLVLPTVKKANWPEPVLLICAAAMTTGGRIVLALAATVPQLMLGEVGVVVGAATTFTLLSSLLSQAGERRVRAHPDSMHGVSTRVCLREQQQQWHISATVELNR